MLSLFRPHRVRRRLVLVLVRARVCHVHRGRRAAASARVQLRRAAARHASRVHAQLAAVQCALALSPLRRVSAAFAFRLDVAVTTRVGVAIP